MTNFIDGVIAKAKNAYKTIVLPEGEDIRVLEAAYRATKERIAKIIVLGDEDEIKAKFAQNGWSLEGITIINPLKSEKLWTKISNLIFWIESWMYIVLYQFRTK